MTESTFVVSYVAVDVNGDETTRMRLRSGVFDLRDGLFLHQFRVFSDYRSMTVSIQYNGKHVANSPYKVGPVLHENCACPLRSDVEWMSDYECPETDPQIETDLEPFRKGVNITNLYERGGEMFPRHSFIHYSIVDSKVCVGVCVANVTKNVSVITRGTPLTSYMHVYTVYG